MKIVIIAPGLLPIPASEGGAVETLIDLFINSPYNQDNSFIVFSGSTHIKENIVLAKNNIVFHQIKTKRISNSLLGRIRRHFDPAYDYKSYLNFIKKELLNLEYDCIIIENRPLFVKEIRKVSKKHIYLHMHNDSMPNRIKAITPFDKDCTIISVSNFIERCIKRDYPASHTITLHNGISTKIFHHEIDLKELIKIRSKYKIKERDIVICFSGRISKTKGVLELLKAYSKLPVLDNIVLLILGASWFNSESVDEYMEELNDVAKTSKNRIVFTGYLDHDLVAEVESVSDIAVLPSLWEEPFALSVLEAMSSELAVITTISGGTPEMFDDKSGILLKRDDNLVDNLSSTMYHLISNEHVRKQIGHYARKRVIEFFDENDYCKSFISILANRL